MRRFLCRVGLHRWRRNGVARHSAGFRNGTFRRAFYGCRYCPAYRDAWERV